MKNRQRVEVLCCTCLRGKKEKRILEKGMSQTESLLEIDNFLRTQMKLQIALKAIFNKAERFLLKNNGSFVIDSSSSGKFQSSTSDISEAELFKQLLSTNSPYQKALLRGTKERKRHIRDELNEMKQRDDKTSKSTRRKKSDLTERREQAAQMELKLNKRMQPN